MKILKNIILIIVFAILAVTVISSLPAMAAASEDDFAFNSDTGTITDYLGSGGAVEIPASIGGVPVTAIGYRSFLQENSVTSVIIPVGVTSIDSGAFLYCAGITSITIPDSVTTIGENAFQGCGNLTGITIPMGVTAINAYTFRDCAKLAEITLPNGLTTIGDRAFWNCGVLDKITIPGTVTSIGEYAFQNCVALKNITIPNGVISIRNNTFNSCTLLESVTLPDSLTSIGDWAFNFCRGLKNINIPNSVTSIGAGAFNNCSGLTGITLPNSVTSISERMFSQCSSLANITLPGSVTSIGRSAFYYCSGLTGVSIPNSVTSIGEQAFEGCGNLAGITIPTGVTVINPSTFKGCGKLTGVTIPNWVTSIGASAFQDCGLTNINIPDSITVINPSTFQGCSKLISLTIPGTVTSIGASAFQDCSGLTSISIPESITVINPSTFLGCSKLDSLTIPSTVTSIGAGAFQGCSSLTDITIPDTVTSISASTFKGCSSLTGIALPNTVTSIGENAFEGCSNLESIIIPDGVTQIGNSTFLYCGKLHTVTLPVTITSIEGAAFHSCYNLKNITIPDGVTYIGGYAFYNCNKLQSINIPAGVTTIENGAFRSCIGLTSISIPSGVTRIGNEAFSSCNNLTSLTIPDLVTSIGSHAFSYCSKLASVTIPDGVASVGQYAFYNCTSLTSIVLPNGLTTVDQRAFQGCSSLTKARFTGNAPSMSNDVFTSTAAGFKVYYYRDKTGFPGDTGGTWCGYNAFPLVSVTYAANDSNGGSVPADGALYEQGQTVTVQGNTGSLTHANADYVFIGWNTAADGSGSRYTGGNTFAIAGGGNITLYAQWRTVHTVLWMSQDGNTILEEDEAAPYGSAPEFNAALPTKASTPAYAYAFVGWATEPDKITPEESLPMVTGNVTYYAAFSETPRSYTVSFNSNGGSPVSSQSIIYNNMADAPDAPTKTGHTLAGWYTDSGLTSAFSFTTPVTDNLTLYAKWTANLYTVSFNSNGGSAVSSQSVSYNNTAATPGEPTMAGHTLAGWYTDSELTSPYSFSTPITGDLTLYAKWTVNTYTVSFDSNGGSPVSSQGIIYNNMADAPDAPTKTGHTFAGWYSNSGLTSAYNFSTPVTDNLTLYANWIPNKYMLSFNAQDGTSNESSREVTYGGAVGVLPGATKPGYTLAGWFTGINGTGTEYLEETEYQTAGNLILYAKWTPNSYTLSFDAQGGDDVLSKNVTYNMPVGSLPGAYKLGYTFEGWFTETNGDGTSYTGATVYETIGNLTLYAKWRPNTYDLPIDPEGGDCDDLTMEVTYDAPMGTLPNATKPGYMLEGWYAGRNGGGIKFTAETIYQFTIELTLYAHWAELYSITYSLNEGTGTAPVEDDKIAGATFTAAASAGMTAPSGKRFKEWNTAADGKGTSYLPGDTVTMSDGDLTLYAIWEAVPASPEHVATVNTSSGQAMTLDVKVNATTGVASVDASSQKPAAGGTVITIPSIPDVGTYSVSMPITGLSAPDNGSTLTIATDNGSITVPSNMLSGISGNKAEISIGQGDKDRLPDDVKAALGGKPLLSLTLSVDGNQTGWNNPGAPVTVSIPYTPTAAELQSPESIVIWYIDGSGTVVTIPSGRFDPITGMVTFNTTHFSDYAVAYRPVDFNDIASDAWYHDAVSFLAAREITTGTGNGNYSPGATLTRGEFIVLLMRAYGLAPDLHPADNFKDAGDTYYTGYLAAAKRLGISAGAGGNLFAPLKEITRQEMFTLVYNALKAIGQLPQGDSGAKLTDFTDAMQIDPWAKDAMTLLVKTGTVSGGNQKLAPLGTATRAEMAQVLFNLLMK